MGGGRNAPASTTRTTAIFCAGSSKTMPAPTTWMAFMWGSERQGALGNALGASHGGAGSDPGAVGCFCEYCEQRARQQGIQFQRVRQGFLELADFVRATRSGKRPVDGYYVTFWRILMRYPEILAWEQFWHDGLREIYSELYQTAHSIKPYLQVGWHIWHNNSFSPFYRAQQDIQQLAKTSDFLKMVMYHNCAGERIATVRRQRHRHGRWRSVQRGRARTRLPCSQLSRTSVRADPLHGTLGRLCVPRSETRGRWRCRYKDADLAWHRHRYPDREKQ